jgi:hypothetical protein
VQIAGVEAKCGRLPSHSFDLADQGVNLDLVRVIRDDDVRAAPRKIEAGVAAETAAASRDDGGLVRCRSNSVVSHGRSPFVIPIVFKAWSCGA